MISDRNVLNFREEKSPIIDVSCFKSYTFRLLTFSSSISYCGLYLPILYLPTTLELSGVVSTKKILILFTYFGLAWILGVVIFGIMIIRKSRNCFISRQYLCQSTLFLCGISLCGVTKISDFQGYILFGLFKTILQNLDNIYMHKPCSLYPWLHVWRISIFIEDVCL